MKKEQGITLTSLVIYIIVMILVIGVMTSVSAMFYQNTNKLSEDTEDIIEYNNFNQYLISEIKSPNVKVDQIGEDGQYILFNDGNSISFKKEAIYFNNIEIAKNVKMIRFSYYTDEEKVEHRDIVTVKVEFHHYQKEMNYKIEEIY